MKDERVREDHGAAKHMYEDRFVMQLMLMVVCNSMVTKYNGALLYSLLLHHCLLLFVFPLP